MRGFGCYQGRYAGFPPDDRFAADMAAAPEALPEFDAPPVVEVILAVGFEPVYWLSNIALMKAWHDLFPNRGFLRLPSNPAML